MKRTILGCGIVLGLVVGCGQSEPQNPPGGGADGGVEINVPGVNIKAGKGGAQIKAPGVNVKAGKKRAEVKFPGGGVKVNQ